MIKYRYEICIIKYRYEICIIKYRYEINMINHDIYKSMYHDLPLAVTVDISVDIKHNTATHTCRID